MTMLNKAEIKLFDKIAATHLPYRLPTDWTDAIQGLWLKKAIVVHDNYARITPDGYRMRELYK